MKLLLDQNLSPNLVNLLADLFPNSTHVQDAGLDMAEDTDLWDYARNNDYLKEHRGIHKILVEGFDNLRIRERTRSQVLTVRSARFIV